MTVSADFAFLHAYVRWVQSRTFDYVEPREKTRFHRESKRVLRILANALTLGPGDYDLRSQMAGFACAGEIILQSSTLYLQLQSGSVYTGAHLMFRRCNGRHDRVGKMNHFAPIHAVLDLPTLAKRIHAVAAR